jgi:gluconate 5-dehydrogenase
MPLLRAAGAIEGYDRHAVITGGAAGLGAGIAARIKAEGGTVEVWDINTEALTASDAHATREIDVTDHAAVAAAMTQANPDILVCSAGITGPNTTTWDYPVDDWLAVHNLNLNAVFYCCRAAAPIMRAKGWGRIVNFASLQTTRAFPGGIAYGATKAGIAQMTRAMAEAWSPGGVTANAIGPGFFPTELTAAVFDDPARAARNAAQTCIGRNGRLEDIDGPLLFLCSDASGYVTGQVLMVDGGFTAK